jgi:hypothetical protein
MPEPTPTPIPPTTPAPAGGSVRVSLAPGAPAPTPAPTPTPDPAANEPPPDPDDQFTSDRQRRRFSELVGRVGTRERERDEARARIEHLLTRNAERIASTSLSEPLDLWLEGAHVTDLLTEDGSDVDPAKVSAVVDALVAKRPGLRRQPEPRPLSGIHGPGQAIPERKTFADAVHRIAAGREGL